MQFKELNLNTDDVVQSTDVFTYTGLRFKVQPPGTPLPNTDRTDLRWAKGVDHSGFITELGIISLKVVSRAVNCYNPWKELSDADKGALLLAAYEGRSVQVLDFITGNWLTWQRGRAFNNDSCYRLRPAEPVVERICIALGQSETGGRWTTYSSKPELKLTFEKKDGVIVWSTFRARPIL